MVHSLKLQYTSSSFYSTVFHSKRDVQRCGGGFEVQRGRKLLLWLSGSSDFSRRSLITEYSQWTGKSLHHWSSCKKHPIAREIFFLCKLFSFCWKLFKNFKSELSFESIIIYRPSALQFLTLLVATMKWIFPIRSNFRYSNNYLNLQCISLAHSAMLV